MGFPAFCSALRLELLEDAENLEFTDEFQLTEKPLQIDCTVVKVKKDCKIKKICLLYHMFMTAARKNIPGWKKQKPCNGKIQYCMALQI